MILKFVPCIHPAQISFISRLKYQIKGFTANGFGSNDPPHDDGDPFRRVSLLMNAIFGG